jgi:hypothetical protein
LTKKKFGGINTGTKGASVLEVDWLYVNPLRVLMDWYNRFFDVLVLPWHLLFGFFVVLRVVHRRKAS